jgi:hypothetical protein
LELGGLPRWRGKVATRHPTDLPINNHVQLPGLLLLRRLLSFAE